MSSNNIRDLYTLPDSEKSIISRKNKLYQMYKPYIENYLNNYKFHMMQEYLSLKREFPDIDFNIEIRVKSEYSYREKIDRKIAEGNTGRIYDIFGSKIIVNSVNGSQEEDKLVDACYKIEDFLNNKCKNSITIPNKSKDYIECPKDNGYKAIHLKRILQVPNEPNNNFLAETQIKTFRMKEHEENGPASHSASYKSRTPLLNSIHNRHQAEYFLPHYLQLVHNTKNHYLTVIEKSFEERFKYFFDIDFDTYMNTLQLKYCE